MLSFFGSCFRFVGVMLSLCSIKVKYISQSRYVFVQIRVHFILIEVCFRFFFISIDNMCVNALIFYRFGMKHSSSMQSILIASHWFWKHTHVRGCYQFNFNWFSNLKIVIHKDFIPNQNAFARSSRTSLLIFYIMTIDVHDWGLFWSWVMRWFSCCISGCDDIMVLLICVGCLILLLIRYGF